MGDKSPRKCLSPHIPCHIPPFGPDFCWHYMSFERLVPHQWPTCRQVLLLSSFGVPGVDFIRQGGNVPSNTGVSWKSGEQQSGGRILSAGANENTVCRLPPSGAIPIVDMSCVLWTVLHTGLLPSSLREKTAVQTLCGATRWDCLSSPSWATSFRHSANAMDDESSDSSLHAR